MSNTFKFALVFIILIGLPAFAYYYLQKGTNMRKEAMSALSPKQEIGHFQATTETDSVFYSGSLAGKRWLIAVIPSDGSREVLTNKILNIYKQTEKEFDFNIFTIVGIQEGELMYELSKKFKWPDTKKWIKTYMASQHVFPFVNSGLNISESYQNKACVILLDEHSMIRNIYDLNDEKEVKHLIQQLPVFLSLK